ncbi:putative N-acetyltransferase YhbS [Kribbella antiqua]|uniref:Putative N-acetyltransferase YhbS n=1 Tax=Kribbella antiqua TaxID=2512217 RepID=A0A4V2S2I6_9ACTN|nr:putative N-acetyltransferase YhbS [Kribbella antiqua]
MEIRPVQSDADYGAWRDVRIAVQPDERALTVAELQELETPQRLLLLAELDGEVVGSGLSDRSSESGRAFVVPRVRPDSRRQGVGTQLLRALSDHAVAQGYERATSGVEEEGSLAFAHRFGFAEIGRQVEQVRRIGDEPWPTTPSDYQVVTVAERPELWAKAYEQVALPTLPDMDVPSALDVSPQEWATEWINDPSAMFMAVVGEDVIGVAGLMLDTDRPERAEVAYTAVRREWRGKAVASTLKRTSMAWAAEHGITEIYTWTQQGNENMRRLNEHLGFSYGTVSIRVLATLPLEFP